MATQAKTPALGTRKRRAEASKQSSPSSSLNCPPPPPQPRRRRRYKRRDMKRSICEPLKDIAHKPGTIVYLKEGVINRAGTFLPWDTLTFDGKPLFPEPYPGPYPHVIAEDELEHYPTSVEKVRKPSSDDFLLDEECRVLGEEDRALGLSEFTEAKTTFPETDFLFPTLPMFAKMEPEEPEPVSWFTEAEKSVIFSLNLDSSDLSQLKQEFYARALSRSLQKNFGLSPLPTSTVPTKDSQAALFMNPFLPFFPLQQH